MSCRKSKVLMVVYVYIKEMLGLALVSGQLKVFCIRVSHFMGSLVLPFLSLPVSTTKTGASKNRSVSSICWSSCYYTFFDCMFRWLYFSVLQRWYFASVFTCHSAVLTPTKRICSPKFVFFLSQFWRLHHEILFVCH